MWMFSFSRCCQFFKVILTIYIPLSHVWKFQLLRILVSTQYCLPNTLIIYRDLRMVSFCISWWLMGKFSCVYETFRYLWEISVQSSAHFSIKSSVFFLMICISSLYIPDESFVTYMYYKYVSSLIKWVIFSPSNNDYWTEVIHVIEGQFINISFLVKMFCSLCKKFLLIQKP